MKILGPVLILAGALGAAALARRRTPPKKSGKPVIKVPGPFQFIIHENQEYELKVPYRIDFTQMAGKIRWRVFEAGAIDDAGELVNPKATASASGTADNVDAGRTAAIAAIQWIVQQKPVIIAYESDGHTTLQGPPVGSLLTVTFDPELMFHKSAQDAEGFVLVDSTPSSFTFQVTKPLAPLDVRDVYVQMSSEGLLLGQHRASALG